MNNKAKRQTKYTDEQATNIDETTRSIQPLKSARKTSSTQTDKQASKHASKRAGKQAGKQAGILHHTIPYHTISYHTSPSHPIPYNIKSIVSLLHDFFEEVVKRGVAVRHHDGPLCGERVVQVADDLHRHIGLACHNRCDRTKKKGGQKKTREKRKQTRYMKRKKKTQQREKNRGTKEKNERNRQKKEGRKERAAREDARQQLEITTVPPLWTLAGIYDVNGILRQLQYLWYQ